MNEFYPFFYPYPNPHQYLRKQVRRNKRLTCGNAGAPGPIRTADTRFRRAVLYPLSYEGVVVPF